ncbi:hypothetical protein FRC04_004781 [Tulasnella sp. 424]|nr:hypothetical protein FRC04_004781 [Tulasnella sp. 424]
MATLPPPYDPTVKESFSYTTVVKRWPVIITNLIDCVYKANHELAVTSTTSVTDELVKKKIEEGKAIIETASKLKYEMGRDKALTLSPRSSFGFAFRKAETEADVETFELMTPIPDDGGPHVELYNTELEKLSANGKGNWFTAPWLYAECYLYRLIRTWFSLTEHWTQFDPFLVLKEDTFKGSGAAVYQLALTMTEIDAEAEKGSLEKDLARLEVLFDEMIQMCFWGNATDLSLLTTLSTGDIEKLQTVGKEAQAASRKYILRDDIDTAWQHLKTLDNARLDIVLDNSGFEYFTDLILADFLVTHTGFINSVVFHPKDIPWFVSDVTPPDVRALLSAISDPSSSTGSSQPYFTTPPPSPAHLSALHKLHYRWLKYFENGTFRVNGAPGLDGGLSGGVGEETRKRDGGMEFWTRYGNYRELVEVEGMAGLEGSGLVIFKGDLNYRKLTGDVQWPAGTTFEEAMGPLAGKLPILSLRTNKADVIAGLPKELVEKMDSDPETSGWRTNGRWGVITFIPKA